MGTEKTTNNGWDKPIFPSGNAASEMDTLFDQIDATVDGGTGISIFLAKGTSTNINGSNYVSWDTIVIQDDNYFTGGTSVDVENDGIYEITADADFYSTNARTNPNLGIQKNGNWVGVMGRSGYMRNADGHDHSSVHASAVVELIGSQDTIKVRGAQEASSETIVPDRAQFLIKKIR